MCNSVRLVLMNASLINSKQVENDITKTLRDFFLKLLKLLPLKSFQLKMNAQTVSLENYMKLLVKRVGFAKNNLKNVT